MPFSRLIIYILIAVLVIYDVFCIIFGWKTISSQMTAINKMAGDLPMWLMAALWLHFYFQRLIELFRGG